MISHKQVRAALLLTIILGSTGSVLGGATGNRVPSYIEVTADGAIIIEASPGWSNPEGCAHPLRIFIPASNVHIDKYYAAALTAISGGRTMWAWVEGCQWMPWNEEYAVVKNIAIR